LSTRRPGELGPRRGAAQATRGFGRPGLWAKVEPIGETVQPHDSHRVLDHVRELGNVRAHAGSPPLDANEVSIGLRFTTHVLRNLFEIPVVLEEVASADAAEAEM
jgi:hypothetical protein